ncbi:hypothetical protein C6353_04235 [Bacillus toyonensis]|nr:hypothetical protein C6353_04235 [Bacillus toyonensis]
MLRKNEFLVKHCRRKNLQVIFLNFKKMIRNYGSILYPLLQPVKPPMNKVALHLKYFLLLIDVVLHRNIKKCLKNKKKIDKIIEKHYHFDVRTVNEKYYQLISFR